MRGIVSRLATSGFEWGEGFAEGLTAPAIGVSGYGTTIVRSGARALISGGIPIAVPVALNTLVYARVYWYVDTTFPTTNVTSVGFDAGSISNRLGIVRAEPDGSGMVSLRFGGSFGTTQVGSNSAALPLNTWVKIEIAMLLGTGAVDTLEGRIDGVTFASGTGLNISDILTGIRAYVQTGDQIISDDFVCNDATGANQNSWPPDSKIVLLRPISLNTNGGSWTDDAAATTSAALTNALDNTPPLGIADTVAGGGIIRSGTRARTRRST